MSGIYIHIPFCGSRCAYCAFYSTVSSGQSPVEKAYTETLCRELRERCGEAFSDTINTIYIGGGTPSIMPVETIGSLLRCIADNYKVHPDAEITFEANPEDLSAQYLAGLRHTGVNRISMGVQTFNDGLLRFLNRRHNAGRAIQAVNDAHKAGFDNISIDLIYGIPGQSDTTLQSDILTAIQLPIKHLSAYCLSYEEGTPMRNLLNSGAITETDEDTLNRFYDMLCGQCHAAGFVQYETSNYAMPGYRSRHNSAYWDGTPYIGIGAAAHSYDGQRIRRWNVADVQRYIAGAGRDYGCETLTDNELLEEFVMLGLRRVEGIDIGVMRHKFGADNTGMCLKESNKFIQCGWLKSENNHIHVTPEGMKRLDYITAHILRRV